MMKMEAFDDCHFMHQAVRGGHTDHTGSIVHHVYKKHIPKLSSFTLPLVTYA